MNMRQNDSITFAVTVTLPCEGITCKLRALRSVTCSVAVAVTDFFGL